jgi:hypothetical protein
LHVLSISNSYPKLKRWSTRRAGHLPRSSSDAIESAITRPHGSGFAADIAASPYTVCQQSRELYQPLSTGLFVTSEADIVAGVRRLLGKASVFPRAEPDG